MMTRKVLRGKLEPHEELVPDPQVWREFGVTSMTGYRWTHDPDLGFPPTIKIGRHNYRSRNALEAFKARLIAEAVKRAGT